MKRVVPALLTLASSSAFAAQPECFETSSNQKVLWIADDYGSISASSMYGRFDSCEIKDDEKYHIWYGEFIVATAVCQNGDTLLISAANHSGDVEGNQLLGRILISKKDRTQEAVAISCTF